MIKYILSKNFILFCCVYFILSVNNLRLKISFTPEWYDGGLIKQHNQLLNFSYINHEQSRLLQFYVPDFFVQLFSLSIPHAYSLRRLLFVFLSFVCFHLYMKKWFNDSITFAGVIFLAAIMPVTYMDHLQESTTILMFLFLLSLWAIREHKDLILLFLLFIGAINNETVLILPMAYFFYRYTFSSWQELFTLAFRTLLLAFPALVVTGWIRYLTKDNGGYVSDVFHLYPNYENIMAALMSHPLDYVFNKYLSFLFVFGLFWIIPWLAYPRLPLFLQRASWIIPVFFIIHLITGIIAESRQMIPLAFLLIPMGLFYLFPQQE
jgi:hypothetical protein